jgi:hypothetical protein
MPEEGSKDAMAEDLINDLCQPHFVDEKQIFLNGIQQGKPLL